MRIRACCAVILTLFAFALLRAAAPAGAGVPPDGERADLQLQAIRWQDLPEDVRYVTVDPTGRAWFELQGKATLPEIKAQVEKSVTLKSPWVRGAYIFMVDGKNRVWILPQDDQSTLYFYDPAAQRWDSHDCHPDDPAYQGQRHRHRFRTEIFQSKAGTLYIAGDLGIYTFSPDSQWNYQPLYPAQGERLHFAEGDDGRVYIWSPWDDFPLQQMAGCWVHDGKTWSHALTNLEEHGKAPRGTINFLAPLKGGRILVFAGEQHRAVPFITTLPADKRQPVIGDFTFEQCQTYGQDRNGNVLFNAIGTRIEDQTKVSGGFMVTPALETSTWQVKVDAKESRFNDPVVFAGRDGSLYLGRNDQGLARIKDSTLESLTGDPERRYCNVLAEDPAGRLFVLSEKPTFPELRSFGGRIAVINRSAPDTRHTLPSAKYAVSSALGGVALDSRGQVWAQLRDPKHGPISMYDDGLWHDAAIPDPVPDATDSLTLQALADGGLVAVGKKQAALYFDGAAWKSYPSLTALVQANAAALIRSVNDRAGVSRSVFLRKDSAGNLWMIDQQRLRVFADGKWIKTPETPDQPPLRWLARLLPADGGKRMLLIGDKEITLAQIKAGELALEVYKEPPFNVGIAKVENPDGLFTDSRGAAWMPFSWTATMLLDADGMHPVPGRPPRYEDSAGRIWFLALWEDPNGPLEVLTPTPGTNNPTQWRRTTLPADPVTNYSSLVEDKPGSLWMTTALGLEHLKVSTVDGKTTVDKLAQYSEGLPRLNQNGLWLDRQQNLWFTHDSREDGSGTWLWRVSISNPR